MPRRCLWLLVCLVSIPVHFFCLNVNAYVICLWCKLSETFESYIPMLSWGFYQQSSTLSLSSAGKAQRPSWFITAKTIAGGKWVTVTSWPTKLNSAFSISCLFSLSCHQGTNGICVLRDCYSIASSVFIGGGLECAETLMPQAVIFEDTSTQMIPPLLLKTRISISALVSFMQTITRKRSASGRSCSSACIFVLSVEMVGGRQKNHWMLEV